MLIDEYDVSPLLKKMFHNPNMYTHLAFIFKEEDIFIKDTYSFVFIS
jgi:hypothetical protein